MKRNDIIEQANARKAVIDSASIMLTDEQAATVPTLYDKWEVGIDVVEGQRLFNEYDEKLYKVNEGMGHTTQADWRPDLVPALYTVIDVTHAGTIEDPIPASRGMEYEEGKYYIDTEDGKTYLCTRGGVLQYLPHELIGHYFEEVTA